jgi:hypothetical protein
MSQFSAPIETFIKNYVKDLNEGVAAIFAGAGLSKSCGFVNWPELLRDIADELGLSVDKEHDLVSLAQYHVNEKNGAGDLSRKIMEEFSDQAELSESHEILARLPIRTYWTTNYDSLIEDSLKKNFRVADVKRNVKDLNTTRPKRDAVVYKMHGDVMSSGDAILYKSQYETYYKSHGEFITALSGDLISKTFLFIGFSFTDPNLDYVLSRLHTPKEVRRNHYCFLRKEPAEPFKGEAEVDVVYRQRKQQLHVQDLKRFGIQALLVDQYEDIPRILKAIEERFLKKTVFISGSAEEYGDWDRQEALNFIHSLSSGLIKSGFRVVNGFGWGIGSAVINGALEAIYSNPEKCSEDQLVMRPFPQVATNGENLTDLWHQYRQRMISLSGIAIFLFGNKLEDGKIANANGVTKEFEIAKEQGVVPIPIGATGYIAKELASLLLDSDSDLFTRYRWLKDELTVLADPGIEKAKIPEKVIAIVKRLGG